ncbi:hypothetical protein [Arenimonas sp. MALMAid1274]|uniref:hypothetical protein n=1 Tax=Arenimonas sp. MALMAid1274 TaxID=3411630 RepID=UPI003BA00D4E
MSDEDEGEDESWAAYYALRVFACQFYGIPLAHDLLGSKYGYRATPAQAMGEAFDRVADDAITLLGGDEVGARKAARNAVNAVGYATGLPLAGPWKHID